MDGSEFQRKLFSAFQLEAREHLRIIRAGLDQLAANLPSDELQSVTAELFRAAHSLRGAARAVGQKEVDGIGAALEQTFSEWKTKTANPSKEALADAARKLRPVTPAIEGTPPPEE